MKNHAIQLKTQKPGGQVVYRTQIWFTTVTQMCTLVNQTPAHIAIKPMQQLSNKSSGFCSNAFRKVMIQLSGLWCRCIVLYRRMFLLPCVIFVLYCEA